MKYVYVLSSSGNDLYYEQFFISLVSLRLHNPKAKIIALVDTDTKNSLTGLRSGYEQYISEVITISIAEELSQTELSRFIKTSIRNYITGDFLYIDCDTVITGSLEYNFPQEINVGAILDTHVPLEKHHLAPYFIAQDKKLKFNSYKSGKRFNGGIIFCRDNPTGKDFFSRWHGLWLYSSKKGSHHDMPPLNQANHEMGGVITELGGEWNCQVTHNGLPFLSSAKIIHCFATSMKLYNCAFLPASLSVLASVKETGTISDELMEMLKNPKAAFDPYSRIISGEIELSAINSKFFSLLLFFRRRLPGLFKSVNSFILKTRARTQK